MKPGYCWACGLPLGTNDRVDPNYDGWCDWAEEAYAMAGWCSHCLRTLPKWYPAKRVFDEVPLSVLERACRARTDEQLLQLLDVYDRI